MFIDALIACSRRGKTDRRGCGRRIATAFLIAVIVISANR
jgi:hypothetical protein